MMHMEVGENEEKMDDAAHDQNANADDGEE